MKSRYELFEAYERYRSAKNTDEVIAAYRSILLFGGVDCMRVGNWRLWLARLCRRLALALENNQ